MTPHYDAPMVGTTRRSVTRPTVTCWVCPVLRVISVAGIPRTKTDAAVISDPSAHNPCTTGAPYHVEGDAPACLRGDFRCPHGYTCVGTAYSSSVCCPGMYIYNDVSETKNKQKSKKEKEKLNY